MQNAKHVAMKHVSHYQLPIMKQKSITVVLSVLSINSRPFARAVGAVCLDMGNTEKIRKSIALGIV